MFDDLWVEKYRPKSLEEIVLSDTNHKILKKFEAEKTIPNLLFVGNAGIGKTSLAKIICNSVLDCQYLYINASDENGIDTIRTKVTNFARTKSWDGNIKCIILDETDGLSIDAQRALRNTMEEHAAITRFILTANYKHRIIPPLQSRCQSFDLTPSVDLCVSRIQHILEAEKITADHDQIETFVRLLYPDLRKCINELQKLTIAGEVNFSNLEHQRDKFVDAIYKAASHGLAIKARKKVIENEHVFSGDYVELLRTLFNHVDDLDIDQSVKTQHLLTVSEHLYRSAFVADHEINFYSCLIALGSK